MAGLLAVRTRGRRPWSTTRGLRWLCCWPAGWCVIPAPARDEIETYHDRVRETVLANLDAAARAEYHKRLAQTLEAAGGVEPEVLAIHFLGAGQAQAAGRYYARAAAQAAEALAFDRAAHLYRRALELGAGDEGPRLRTGLADALANAGRGAEAGREYLVAAQRAAAATAIDLRRSAAFQFLTSGHVDEGLGVSASSSRRPA